jgi:hypothetical protein
MGSSVRHRPEAEAVGVRFAVTKITTHAVLFWIFILQIAYLHSPSVTNQRAN